MLDKEIDGLASHALTNAFYMQFSEMVAHYVKAAEGLETFDKSMLQDVASVYGVVKDLQVNSRGFIIKYVTKDYIVNTNSLHNALSLENAMKIYINDVPYFEKYGDGWRAILG